MDTVSVKYLVKNNRKWVEILVSNIPLDTRNHISNTIDWDNPKDEYIIYVKESQKLVYYKIQILDKPIYCCRDLGSSGDIPGDHN